MTTERPSQADRGPDADQLADLIESLTGKRRGLYVHVGAGLSGTSISSPLYERGWRGIVLEPDIRAAADLRRARPEDLVVQLAAADRAQAATMWVPRDRPADATMSPTRAGRLARDGVPIEPRRVTTTTVADVLAAHEVTRIDLLVIEAQGAARAVIIGTGLERLRPAAVLLDEDAETWRDDLLRAGLRLAATLGRWHLFAAAPSAPANGRGPRPRVLHVLSSSNQLYSGLGRNLFALVERQLDQFEIEFAIDDLDQRNVDILGRFCEGHRLPFHVGRGVPPAGTLDAGNDDLAELLEKDRWDIVEIVGWANAATHATVLESREDTVVAFTPHYQPSWTVPMDDRTAQRTEEILAAVIARATLVCCDSQEERHRLTGLAGPHTGFAVIPLGFDPERFRPGPADRPPSVLFVGDLNEPRKRPDRTIAVFAEAWAACPDLRLQVVGNAGDTRLAELVPPEVVSAVRTTGYVDDASLEEAYRQAAVLLLLSDYEAFGLPVVEALASGTPVLLTDTPVNRSNFDGVPGIHFCDPDDTTATAGMLTGILERSAGEVQDVIGARDELARRFGWEELAQEKSRRLLTAWLRVRHGSLTRRFPRTITERAAPAPSPHLHPADRVF